MLRHNFFYNKCDVSPLFVLSRDRSHREWKHPSVQMGMNKSGEKENDSDGSRRMTKCPKSRRKMKMPPLAGQWRLWKILYRLRTQERTRTDGQKARKQAQSFPQIWQKSFVDFAVLRLKGKWRTHSIEPMEKKIHYIQSLIQFVLWVDRSRGGGGGRFLQMRWWWWWCLSVADLSAIDYVIAAKCSLSVFVSVFVCICLCPPLKSTELSLRFFF